MDVRELLKRLDTMTWDDCKQAGSEHYKTGQVEPIDLYESVTPHPSLNALQVKALTDNIKYSYRMLTRGMNAKDTGKIIHYAILAYVSEKKKGKA
jgi:hypothetical protein